MESKVSPQPLQTNPNVEQLLSHAGEYPVRGARESVHALLENVSIPAQSYSSYSNDAKAQKNGAHRSVYWVKKKKRQEDGSIKGEMWESS